MGAPIPEIAGYIDVFKPEVIDDRVTVLRQLIQDNQSMKMATIVRRGVTAGHLDGVERAV